MTEEEMWQFYSTLYGDVNSRFPANQQTVVMVQSPDGVWKRPERLSRCTCGSCKWCKANL